MSAERDFTKGPIIPSLIKFALPVLAASLLQAAYGAADLLIVGNFGDSSSVSAVSIGSEAMLLVTCIIMGLTMGATVLIGQRIGNKDAKGAGDAVGAACGFFLIVAVIMSVFMQIIAEPLCHLLNAPDESFDKAVSYIRICSGGIIFITAYNVISGIFRGIGNSKLPMIFVAISASFNVVGDLILCGVVGLDAAGAAIATISAQALSVVLSVVIIKRQELPFKLSKKSISFKSKDSKLIFKLGLPLATQDASVHISFLVVSAFANAFGLSASAGYGVAVKISDFLFLIPIAVGSSVTAIVSQNVGAGLHERARSALFKTMRLGIILGTVMWAIGFFFAPQLALVFTDDEAVIENAALQLRGFSFDLILTNALFAFVGFFNGNGKTYIVMIQGIASSLLIRIPLVWFFSTREWGSLFYFGLSTPITSVLGIIFFIVCYRRFRKQNPVKEIVDG